MKSVRCPSCGTKMKRNGKTSAGRQRHRPARVPRLAHVQGLAVGDARAGKVLQAQGGQVLGGVADARRGRRVAPRPPRRRDLARTRPRRVLPLI